jgi:hypothetical protein
MSYILMLSATQWVDLQLGLTPDSHMQDWEIERANGELIVDWIDKIKDNFIYIEQRRAFFALVLASYVDLVQNDRKSSSTRVEGWIRKELTVRKEIYDDISNYWIEYAFGEHRLNKVAKILKSFS